MIVKRPAQERQTFEWIQAFASGSQSLNLELTSHEQAYGFVTGTLCRFGYKSEIPPDLHTEFVDNPGR